MNWLITGGCGFIGLNLVRRLVESGDHNVRVVDSLSSGSLVALKQLGNVKEIDSQAMAAPADGLEFVLGDILDRKLMAKVCSHADTIVHLAANTGVQPSVENPIFDCETNVVGTINLLEAARATNAKRFVFSSSGAPVGSVTPPIHENLPARPVSPYGASKLAGEAYCSAYANCFGVETVALRFGNVYGPGSTHKQSVVARFLNAAFEGSDLEIYGNGHQTRDFIYVDDLVEAILLAASADGSKVSGEIFQIATNRETSVRELLDVVLNELKKVGLESPSVRYSDPRVGDVERNFSDTSKARNLLGWESSKSLSDGICATVEHFLTSRKD